MKGMIRMKNKKKEVLDVVFIIDKSGSMAGSEEHTISSFNEYLMKEKKNSFKTNITTILFSDEHQYLHKRIPVSDVKELTIEEYNVGGCTALYDSLGDGIKYIEKENCDKVLFIIITDGYENASRKYNKNYIKKLIKEHNNWEFIYIGADIDSYEAGNEIGIKKANIANYKKTAMGTSKLFKAVEAFECSMMNDDTSTNWKDDLD